MPNQLFILGIRHFLHKALKGHLSILVLVFKKKPFFEFTNCAFFVFFYQFFLACFFKSPALNASPPHPHIRLHSANPKNGIKKERKKEERTDGKSDNSIGKEIERKLRYERQEKSNFKNIFSKFSILLFSLYNILLPPRPFPSPSPSPTFLFFC
jgi:hypothetical protein